MVALIRPNPVQHPNRLRRPARGLADEQRPNRSRHLRVVPDDEGSDAALVPTVAFGLLAVVLAIGFVVTTKSVQGQPPATDWQTISVDSAVGPADPGVLSTAGSRSNAALLTDSSGSVVVVVAGDSWWTLAQRIAADVADPEAASGPVAPQILASQLVVLNGGGELTPGRTIEVPTLVPG